MLAASRPQVFTLTGSVSRGAVFARPAVLTKAEWLSGTGPGLPQSLLVVGGIGKPAAPPRPTGVIHGLGPLLDGVAGLPLVPVIFERDDGRR